MSSYQNRQQVVPDKRAPSEANVEHRWINASKLIVDESYQRSVRWGWVRELARAFDPDQLKQIEVSDRGNDTFAVLDGQHRLLAVREIGWGDQDLSCMVRFGMTVADEARFFAAQRFRRGLSRYDSHRADLVAGDPTAVAVQNVVDQTPFVIATAAGQYNIQAVQALYRITEKYGPASLLFILRLCEEVWDSSPRMYALAGIAYFYNKFPMADHDIVRACLVSETQSKFEGQSKMLRETLANRTEVVGAFHLYQMYNKRVRNKARKLDAWLIGDGREEMVKDKA